MKTKNAAKLRELKQKVISAVKTRSYDEAVEYIDHLEAWAMDLVGTPEGTLVPEILEAFYKRIWITCGFLEDEAFEDKQRELIAIHLIERIGEPHVINMEITRENIEAQLDEVRRNKQQDHKTAQAQAVLRMEAKEKALEADKPLKADHGYHSGSLEDMSREHYKLKQAKTNLSFAELRKHTKAWRK